jgi:hypothetical protein
MSSGRDTVGTPGRDTRVSRDIGPYKHSVVPTGWGHVGSPVGTTGCRGGRRPFGGRTPLPASAKPARGRWKRQGTDGLEDGQGKGRWRLAAIVRCSSADCLRPAWRDGLCWWCWQMAHPVGGEP